MQGKENFIEANFKTLILVVLRSSGIDMLYRNSYKNNRKHQTEPRKEYFEAALQ